MDNEIGSRVEPGFEPNLTIALPEGSLASE